MQRRSRGVKIQQRRDSKSAVALVHTPASRGSMAKTAAMRMYTARDTVMCVILSRWTSPCQQTTCSPWSWTTKSLMLRLNWHMYKLMRRSVPKMRRRICLGTKTSRRRMYRRRFHPSPRQSVLGSSMSWRQHRRAAKWRTITTLICGMVCKSVAHARQSSVSLYHTKDSGTA